jgi:hypothetical protein
VLDGLKSAGRSIPEDVSKRLRRSVCDLLVMMI